MNEHEVLGDNTNLHLLIFPTCNDILIRKCFLNKKIHVKTCKLFPSVGPTNCAICPSWMHEWKYFYESKHWNNGYFKWFQTLSLWVNKPLLLITIHNLVIALVSNGLTTALLLAYSCNELKHAHMQVQDVSIQRFWNLQQWRFHILWFIIMFTNDTKMKGGKGINIRMHM
jgi:hypothetical protein